MVSQTVGVCCRARHRRRHNRSDRCGEYKTETTIHTENPIQKILQTLLFKYSIIPADETRVAAEKRLSGRDAPTETGREDAQSLSSVG